MNFMDVFRACSISESEQYPAFLTIDLSISIFKSHGCPAHPFAHDSR
jgi:hypothetical protein